MKIDILKVPKKKYADVRLLCHIASRNTTGEQALYADIRKSMGTTPAYTNNICRKLCKAGLVKSTVIVRQGVRGNHMRGFHLTQKGINYLESLG